MSAMVMGGHRRVSIGRRVRIGLVGCGERGAAYAEAISRSRNAKLVVAMDLDAELAKRIAQHHWAAWTSRFADVIHREDVDAVFICLPHHEHAGHAVEAARCRKHLMVEKPLATTLEDAAHIVHAAQEAGVKLSMCLDHRYQPAVQRAKTLIQAGVLGNLLGTHFVFQRETAPSYWESGLTGCVRSDWRTSWEKSGGGILITNIIHYLDWMRYLTGLEIVEVSVEHATLESPGDVEDSVALWMRYANGALGTLNASYCVQGLPRPLVEFRLWGTDGHLSLTPPYQFYSLRLIEGKRPGFWHSFGPLVSANPLIECISRFADAVLTGGDPEISAKDSLAVQAVIDAAYRSARERRPIKVEQVPC
ncbi:MAG: Gfo/Idh/MocA family oxidoreductase [Candidatus Omnitrophica bacterium]|nr:Gfo/Idh/MocA family oxidoreductase [Candidatus Omnitrophota bacterium]